MNTTPSDPKALAEVYLHADQVVSNYGSGKDGAVFKSSRKTAVKVHEYRSRFEQELAVYQRLADEKVFQVLGANVPRLLGFSSKLLVIEMSTVKRPFVIDFATSALDVPPDFSEEVWQEWREQRASEFGDRWPRAVQIFDYLRTRHGIWHLDFSPRNVDLNEVG